MKKYFAMTAIALALSSAAHAEVRINGFANLVGGMTSSDDTLYGYDDNISFSEDSLFAIQISGDINDKMTATAQLLARGAEDYDPDFEWAYLTYAASDNLTITAGRFRLPLFTYSSSLDVGYSYHWLSVPSVVYDVPFNNMDGIKIAKTGLVGDWDYLLDINFGQFKGETFGADNIGDNTGLVSLQFSDGEWTVRGVYGRTSTTIDLTRSTDPVGLSVGQGFAALESLGFAELAGNLKIEEDTGEFVGVSVTYDNFDYFWGAEYTNVKVDDSFANDDDAFYLTAGKRFGKWTPSITYESFESSGDVKYANKIAAIGAAPLPAEVIAQLMGVAIGSQMAQQDEFDVVTATIRYDFDTNIAIKADVSRYSDDVDASADATLVRFGVNYVF
ncbi:porin [Alteromonas facilis]|uniref:porin n=1 Tax=Alteromonas facilis TaxID=2048004 RepID=UPI000C28A743|nr:porin [Alteromonas facilis]